MTNAEPIFKSLTDAHPEVVAAMTRSRWSYAAALKAADEAIAEATARAKRIYAAQKKAAKRAPRKAGS